jgi:hypothetical protein
MVAMRRAIGLWVVALAGCGRIDFGPDDAVGEPIGDLADDFDDGVLAEIWFTYGQAPPETAFRETGGRLVIELADGVAESYAGYVTRVGHDLRGRAMTVQLVEVPAAADVGCYATLVTPDEAHELDFTVATATLTARVDDVAFASAPFDPSAQSWWRIRELDGVVIWETSPDGRAWARFAERAAPAFVAGVRPNIGGGTQRVVALPGRCAFDNFGLPP